MRSLFFILALLAAPVAAQQGRQIRVGLDAQTQGIAVVYPDLAEPYRSVFNQIIEGVEEKSPVKVERVAIGTSSDPASIAEDLKRRNFHTVIALGRNGLKMADTLGPDVTVIGGGVIAASEEEVKSQAILSLAPDPALLFAKLKLLAPKVGRVFVVYDPVQTGWLIGLASKAAKGQGVELAVKPASDLKSALLAYKDILSEIDPQRDSVWLPQDPTTVEESTVVPLLLQEAWNRQFVLFSSNIGYVRRGALFALYPNNKALGHSLAAVAAEAANGSRRTGLQPLGDVLMGINVRTADHLGLALNKAEQQGFDLVFPER